MPSWNFYSSGGRSIKKIDNKIYVVLYSDKNQGEKSRKGDGVGVVAVLDRMAKESLTEKVTFE